MRIEDATISHLKIGSACGFVVDSIKERACYSARQFYSVRRMIFKEEGSGSISR
ncbi:hypothetical protein HS088_TW10G00817 [Tripterygium wilfordii]|uniref:Uncharacterized protein n=1 Tax=Tripterygium wilfordii TaxID=458696 RepID=A0A7J7D673_TRIWF|nr:hypothetical protein HS088_TW10G00817 [Tripterygium wilfordii]